MAPRYITSLFMGIERMRLFAATVLILTLPFVAQPLYATEAIVFEKEIEYSNPDDQHLQVDMARPDGEGPYPAIICIHGGGFRAGTRQGYDGLIKKLAKNG